MFNIWSAVLFRRYLTTLESPMFWVPRGNPSSPTPYTSSCKDLSGLHIGTSLTYQQLSLALQIQQLLLCTFYSKDKTTWQKLSTSSCLLGLKHIHLVELHAYQLYISDGFLHYWSLDVFELTLRPRWPQNQRSISLCFPSARIKSMCWPHPAPN